jgi:hypothetical protein
MEFLGNLIKAEFPPQFLNSLFVSFHAGVPSCTFIGCSKSAVRWGQMRIAGQKSSRCYHSAPSRAKGTEDVGHPHYQPFPESDCGSPLRGLLSDGFVDWDAPI